MYILQVAPDDFEKLVLPLSVPQVSSKSKLHLSCSGQLVLDVLQQSHIACFLRLPIKRQTATATNLFLVSLFERQSSSQKTIYPFDPIT